MPLRLSTAWPSWMNAAGTERIFRSPMRSAASARSSRSAWTFVIEPRRLKVTSVMVPDARRPAAPLSAGASRELLRSLDRMETDLAELRSEVERMRGQIETDASRARQRPSGES